MPIHIGFLDRLKIGISMISMNAGQSRRHREVRRQLAQVKAANRVETEHPEWDQIQKLRAATGDLRQADHVFSYKDMRKAYLNNVHAQRHTLLDSYVIFRREIDRRGPHGEQPYRGEIPEAEWVNCLAPDTVFDTAVRSAFSTGYRILLVNRGAQGRRSHQIKRLEAFKGDVWRPEKTVIMWSHVHD